MNVNPYESPRKARPIAKKDSFSKALAVERAKAAGRFTQTILVLAVPAVFNLLLFNHFVTGGVSPPLFYVLATLNAIGVAFAIFSLLFGGFFVSEKLTQLANRLFGKGQKLDQWNEALYDVLEQAWFLAIPAAMLWAFWLVMVYFTDVPYLFYGLPSLAIAHLMAASLYIRLLWRWYKTRQR